ESSRGDTEHGRVLIEAEQPHGGRPAPSAGTGGVHQTGARQRACADPEIHDRTNRPSGIPQATGRLENQIVVVRNQFADSAVVAGRRDGKVGRDRHDTKFQLKELPRPIAARFSSTHLSSWLARSSAALFHPRGLSFALFLFLSSAVRSLDVTVTRMRSSAFFVGALTIDDSPGRGPRPMTIFGTVRPRPITSI